MNRSYLLLVSAVCGLPLAWTALAQRPDAPPDDLPPFREGPGGFRGPGGPFGFGRPGGFGGVREGRKLVAQFDKDGDKRLNAAERQAAREFLAKERAEGGYHCPHSIRRSSPTK